MLILQPHHLQLPQYFISGLKPTSLQILLVLYRRLSASLRTDQGYVTARHFSDVRYLLLPVRLSSVCRLSSVTLVHLTQPIVFFGNISTALGTLAIL